MRADQPHTTPAANPNLDEQWADIADLALMIAREIQLRPYVDKRALKLSLSEGMVMRYLQNDSSATPGRIAAAIGLQRTNLSVVLRGLERKGLVERRTGQVDRREVTVHLTERGAEHYALVRREWAAAVSAAAGEDSRNLDAALGLLAAVQAGLVKNRPPAGPLYDRDGRLVGRRHRDGRKDSA
jgi:DNA-binding MarR family transcriptional regulator